MTTSPSDWLIDVINKRRGKKWCINWSCTTCGARDIKQEIKAALNGKPNQQRHNGLIFLNVCERFALEMAIHSAHDLLFPEERRFLELFSKSVDYRLPSQIKKREMAIEQEQRQMRLRELHLKQKADELASSLKRAKDEAQLLRIEAKNARDRQYWQVYWATRNAVRDEHRAIERRKFNRSKGTLFSRLKALLSFQKYSGR